MFLSMENTLINLDSVARLDYIEPKIDPAYIQITYKNGIVENIVRLKDGSSKISYWEEFQYIRQELLRHDCIIPVEMEVNNYG